jgi:poly(3-hydroxybutyrate) depolymerase
VLEDWILASELLDTLTSAVCIDRSRIYIAGLPNGGGLTGTFTYGLTINIRIAAFVRITAAIYTDDSSTEPLFGAGCDPQLDEGRKVLLVELHGHNDSG